MRRLFDYFLFSSLFISCCAVLMTYQTTVLFGLPISWSLLGFVFSGTLCSYNFHWYLTPVEHDAPPGSGWHAVSKPAHLVLALIGLLGASVCAFFLLDHWFWLGTTAVFTFLYSAPKIQLSAFAWLKKIAVGKTIFLAFAWMHVTTLLPMVVLSTDLTDGEIWFAVNRFFYIYAICVLFDYRDVENDRSQGIKTMITMLTERGVDLLFFGSIVAYLISLALMLEYIGSAATGSFLIPGIVLVMLYSAAKKNFSDYLYYFVLDGLMMLSAPLLLLIKFAAQQ